MYPPGVARVLTSYSLSVARSEFLDDPENRIVRPFQVYVGSGVRDYVPVENRTAYTDRNIVSEQSAESKRRNAATSEIEWENNQRTQQQA